ncbi:MAG: hypothetical protein AAGM38_11650 [Pseudomonadota bacterium]
MTHPSLLTDLRRLAAARWWVLAAIALGAMIEPRALAPAPSLSLYVEIWRYALMLLGLGAAFFLLLHGAQRLDDGDDARGGAARRWALFFGWWIGLALVLDFARAQFGEDAAAWLYTQYVSLAGALHRAEGAPSVADLMLARAVIIAPSVIAWIVAWALLCTALAIAAAGRDEGPLRSLGVAGFWRRLGLLLITAGVLRIASITALAALPSSFEAAQAAMAAPFGIPDASTAAIRLAAGAGLAAAMLIEATIAHRALWERRGAADTVARAFE